MKLRELDFENSFNSSIYCERYINDSKGRFDEYSEVNPVYDPQGSTPQIQVPYTWIKEEDVEVYQSNPSLELLSDVHMNGKYKFFWHPDTIRTSFIVNGYTPMQPTSSTRTMLAMDSLDYYVKTDLDKKHFRFIRRLKKNSVVHSVEICEEIRKLIPQLTADSTYSFLPESLGLVILNGLHKDSGVLFRETRPAIVYDGMIGRYLLSRLTKTFCKYYENFDYKTVSSEIARRFHLIPNNITDMFPRTTYKFGNSALDQVNNEVILVDTGELPDFR